MSSTISEETSGTLPAVRPADCASSRTALAALLCVALFLLINPFLALFALALISLFVRVPGAVFIPTAALSFAVFYFSRDYGIEWYPLTSTDDVPTYIFLYQDNYGVGFGELFTRYLFVPNGNEPLWHLPWWFLVNAFDASDETFVFLHYLVVFVAAFLAISTLSRRYLIQFVLIYFFLTPIALDSVAHIWRNQMAFAMFLAGIGLLFERRLSIGRWLIYLSPLMHFSLVFFVLGFIAFEFVKKVRGFDNKAMFSALLIALLVTVPLLSSMMVAFLDSIGFARIMAFFEGYGADVRRIYLLIGFYAIPLLGAFYFFRSDDTNNLFLVLCFSVFSIVMALPGANGIYDRLLMFVLPLLGFYFFRVFLAQFPLKLLAPLLCVVFAVGSMRLYLPTREGSGLMSFLAFGHAFDPTMGLAKLLAGLP